MIEIELSNELIPYEARAGGDWTPRCTVTAMKNRNGDIEFGRNSRDGRSVITVIPKEKRAALAQFLVSND